MKKTLMAIALFAILLFTASGFNENRFGIMPGDRAPMIELENNNLSTSLADCKGRFVILSFWKSDDALSRSQAATYGKWISQNNADADFVQLAVNFDENTALFEHIVQADAMNSEAQFNVKGKEADKISADFKLDGAFGTLLISDDGHILAVNPDTHYLSSLLGKQKV